MKKYLSIGLSILILASVIIGSALWVRAFYDSVKNYRSPLRQVDLSAQAARPAERTRVVIVMMSGLGYDASLALNLPILEQIRQIGATAAVQSIPPTYSQTAWATLVTGAPPDSNDAPPLDAAPQDLYLLETDTIFARAQAVNLQTALLGSSDWRRLIPRNQLDYAFFVDKAGREADQVLMEAALPIIESGNFDLVVLQLAQINFAGQTQGGSSSPAYAQAAQAIDTYLGQISRAMDLSRSVLVLLADHGHIVSGGYGGSEVEVIWQPLVMIGQNINPGTYSDIYQTDIAPTIATLLGSAAPTATQGRILFEMIRLTDQTRAEAQLGLARQRMTLAEAYLAQITPSEAQLPPALLTDLAQAETAFTHRNLNGAFKLALLTQQEADRQISLTKNSRASREQLIRFIVALFIVVIWFSLIWRRRGFHAGSIVVVMIITLALYHILYQLQGYDYSISSFNDFSALPFEVARRTALSLLVGGGLLLILLLLAGEENWLVLLGTCYGFGVLVTFVFILPVFWAFWQNGLTANWHLPAVGPAFWQVTGLLEALSAAILGLLLPWPITGLSLFVNLIRRRLDEARARAEQDALTGLHF